MRELGLTAFRFSVSWSRFLPEGTGRVNAGGLDFTARSRRWCQENNASPRARPAGDRHSWGRPTIPGLAAAL